VAEPRPCGPVLVVEDDEQFRTFVASLLREAGFPVIEVESGSEALAAARSEAPAAAVLDICLPGLSGYEVCRALKEERPALPVLFMSGERTEPLDRAAGLLIGADDYLVKPFAADELLARLRAALRRSERPAAPQRFGLTRRELEVLARLADGLGHAEIAEALRISPKTVGTHVEHIFQKLGVRSRAQAVAAAYRERLLDDVRAQQLTT
jgi:DNA-binding NarL/FixJ family response regulator